MLSPKATAAQGAAAGRQPVGSGPFVVSEWAARDHITLARNPLYARRAPWSNHQGPPYLDRVVWRIIPETGTRAVTIQSGETQMITLLGAPGSVLAGLRSDPALRIESVPYPGSSRLLALNAKRPPTDDLRVRRAINYGVNRAAFFDSIYKGLGTPACAPIDQVLLRDPDACAAYPYNPARAAGLLDEAGWKMGPNNIRERDGKPLSFVINSLTYGGGNFPEIELLQGQLLALGFDATIKTQAQAPWYEDNYHCADNGRTFFLRTNDPDLLSALFESTNIGGNFNWFCYANPEVDRLLTAGREEFNPAKRRAIYLRIERIVTDDAVSMPLVDILQVWAIRNTVTGTKYNYLTYPALSDVRVK